MRVVQEHIQHPDQSFRLLRLVQDAFALERHRHPHWELTWIEQGNGVRFVSDDASAYTSGDMVLLGANVPHTWKSLHTETMTQSVATVLQFPGELIETKALPELAQLQPLMLLARRGVRISGTVREQVAAQLCAMHTTDAMGRLLGLFGILRCLALHVHALQPIAHLEIAAAARVRDGRVDRVVQWMHANLGGTLRLEDAAAQAHISTAAFSRFFKRETGKTFTDYLNEVRCAQACAWLSDSVLPVSTIASQCGFETSSHFNRQFKNRFGVTPRAYRKRSG